MTEDWAAWVQALAAVASLLLTLWLILYSHRGWEAAAKAAVATRESADIARDALVESRRPWLLQTKCHPARLMDPTPYHAKSKQELELRPEPDQIGWAILIVWKNCGLSPALDVRGFGHGKKFDLSDDTPFTLSSIDRTKRPTSNVVAPQGEVITRAIKLTYDECREIALGRLEVLIYGRMEYRDGFANTPLRHTDVCFRVEVGDNPRTSKDPFIFTGYHEHNRAD